MSTEPIACKDCRHHVHLPESIAVCVSDDAPDSFDAVYGVYRSELLPACIQVNHDGKCPHSSKGKAMSERLTACRDCDYMIDRGDKLVHCAVAPYGREFDYMSGKMLRMVCYSTDHIPCRFVNIDGHCPHFSQKKETSDATT